jgi:Spy/CpxP family protein refolding chaperone
MWKPFAAIFAFGAVLVAQPPAAVSQPAGSPGGRPDGKGFGRGPRQWWEGDVSKNANLSEAQQKQVLEIRKEFRPRMMDVQRAVNKADADLAAAFNEDAIDQAKANDAINRLATARAELTRTVSQFSLKLRTVLTAQQWQQLQGARPPWPDRPGGRRRGPSTSTSTTTNNQK